MVLVLSAMVLAIVSQLMMVPDFQVWVVDISKRHILIANTSTYILHILVVDISTYILHNYFTPPGAPPPPPLILFCRGATVPPIVSSGPDMLLLFRFCFQNI